MTDKHSHNYPPSENLSKVENHRGRLSEFYPDKAQEEEVLEALRNIAKMAVGLSWGAENIQTLFQHIFEKAGADSGKLLEQKMNTEFKSVVTLTSEDKNQDHD